MEADSYKHHMKMAWQVVRFTQDKFNPKQDNKFYCKETDIIKFGRVRFRIRKLRINHDDKTESDQ